MTECPAKYFVYSKFTRFATDNEEMGPHSFTVCKCTDEPIGSDELVLTIPGMLSRKNCMRDLSASLQSAGYETWHWSYPSLRGSISRHVARLTDDVIALANSPAISRIHFVAHSMGSVIARAAILESQLETRFREKCGRIVMLAPPNRGSRLTRFPLGPFASWFPQLTELSESPSSYVRSLPRLRSMSVGVIAAAHDRVVEPHATHLPGEREHAILPTTHQRLISDLEAIAMSIRFLRDETFQTRTAPVLTRDGFVRAAA